MGLIKAFSGALSSTLSDQWIDVYTSEKFDEHSLVVPSYNLNQSSSSGIITTSSKIYVPENACAVIFSENGIEDAIFEPGGYEYTDGQDSIFNGASIDDAIIKQIKTRFAYSGISPEYKSIIFINLREIRNIKFGTHGPLVYNDCFYGVDLEILGYGSFTIKVTDPIKLICNFVPPNVERYSMDNQAARSQIISEFLQSFSVALNSMSEKFRISQLPSQANTISKYVKEDSQNAGTWPERFGFEIVSVAIENIEFSEDARELVNKYSATRMDMKAYDNISSQASNIRAQQKIAEGIQENGLGNGGGMIMGMNVAQSLNPTNASSSNTIPTISLDEQIDALKKLKELVDAGILSQEEFDMKKKQIMNL